MTTWLPLFFAAPFAICGVAVSAWVLWEIATHPITDPYDDENNWGA